MRESEYGKYLLELLDERKGDRGTSGVSDEF